MPRRALFSDRRLLGRDTITSRDRFRPMGARQNLALYYNNIVSWVLNFILRLSVMREPIKRPETEEIYCFYCTTLIFEQKLPRRALFADRRLLRRDTITSFRPMGARQNLALYYNNIVSWVLNFRLRLSVMEEH